MKGTLMNAVAVAGGALLGMIIKKGVPERYQKIVMQGLGIATLIIGIQMAVKTQNMLILIISFVAGGLVGEWIGIDNGLQRLGNWVTEKLGSKYGHAGEGFITASLLYCIGAMAIVGSIQEGLTGDATTLYAKSVIDGVYAIVFGSVLGIGVALSSISIIIYQGLITVLAQQASGLFSDAVVREVTAIGGALIIAISLTFLEIKKLQIANLLPAIPIAAIISLLSV